MRQPRRCGEVKDERLLQSEDIPGWKHREPPGRTCNNFNTLQCFIQKQHRRWQCEVSIAHCYQLNVLGSPDPREATESSDLYLQLPP